MIETTVVTERAFAGFGQVPTCSENSLLAMKMFALCIVYTHKYFKKCVLTVSSPVSLALSRFQQEDKMAFRSYLNGGGEGGLFSLPISNNGQGSSGYYFSLTLYLVTIHAS